MLFPQARLKEGFTAVVAANWLRTLENTGALRAPGWFSDLR
jgi:hypothetical protein